jgi:O-acetyl-ADP-ribose deacetylase (regulator of RNase III)
MVTIKEIKGSALAPRNGIIVHGCNAQGKMASGFAKSLRQTYPGAYRVYLQAHEKDGLKLGQVIYYRHPAELDGSQVIIANAITQQYYGRNKDIVYVSYPAISTCFENVAKLARETGLPVHFPLVGCGLANGQWHEVSARIEQALGPDIDKTLWIYP